MKNLVDKTKNIAVRALLLVLVPCLSSAMDHLEITVMTPDFVDGRPAATVQEGIAVLVRAVNADGSTDIGADFIHANLMSPDVPANLPPSAYLVNGERIFNNVIFLDDGNPVRLQVQDLDDVSVPFGEIEINVYKHVNNFLLSVPVGDKNVGAPVAITITARDGDGVPVRNFNDDVTLTAGTGSFVSGPFVTVPGGDFSFGTATVDVFFLGIDPAMFQNTLTATGSVVYADQPGAATGSVIVAPLYPGPLARVIMVMPGETLTPGTSPGKSGLPTPQISGFSFGDVDVYATDQYWNPVRTGPYPTLSWTCDDVSPGVVLPAGGAMLTNAEFDEHVTLVQSGQRQLTVNATGPITDSSTSLVYINPAGLDRFRFDYAFFDTTSVQVTTSPFPITVLAEDAFGNPFPYNGPVSMRVLIGETDESADYLITSSSEFIDGRLDAMVQVTKRAFITKLVIDSNTGIISHSGEFQVNSGILDRILFTFPGETWVPGLNDETFSGNMGSPNDMVTGNLANPVMIRMVDKYGNLVSGSRVVTVTCTTGYMFFFDSMMNLIEGGVITINGPTACMIAYRTAGEQQVQGVVSGGASVGYSTPATVKPFIYYRMVCIAPGETLDPGTYDIDGKLGSPVPRDAGVSFDVDVYAVDYFYNPISNMSANLPVNINLTSSDAAATLPAGVQTMLSNHSTYPVTLYTVADPNRQTIVVTDVDRALTNTVEIPVMAGPLDHFDVGVNSNSNPSPFDALSPIPDHQAGSPLADLTIVARDVYDNHISVYTDSVTLSMSCGGNVLTPSRVSLVDGYGVGSYEGAWRGVSRITRAGTDFTINVVDDVYGRTGVSNAFDVFTGPFAKILVTLPGEVPSPGEAPGKQGVAIPLEAGETVTATVTATDTWWNPVTDRPFVHLQDDDYHEMLSVNDVQLDVGGQSDFDLVCRTAETHTLAVSDLAVPARCDTSRVVVDPAAFDRLMLVTPGETPEPGGFEGDGKSGMPDPQIAALNFPVQVLATDRFWNPISTVTDRVHLDSDEGSLGPGNPLENDQSLTAGQMMMSQALMNVGPAQLTVSNLDDPGIASQSVPLQIITGGGYRVTVPATALVGPPESFPVTIERVNDLGNVEPEAFNDVQIRALLSSYSPAPGNLLVADATLDGGVVTIPAQAYDIVGTIVLEVSDSSGRTGYSSTIDMQPNGLAYEVVVPVDGSPIVGPPAVFPVTVNLRESVTGTLVDDDRFVDFEILDASGLPGSGEAGTTRQKLTDGVVTFDQSYTRAGSIIVAVSDSTGLTGQSPVFQIGHNGYRRLQILAPGETAEPGVAAHQADGKSGTPIGQPIGERFTFEVRAVDQYWNPVDTVSGGRIHYDSDDGAFGVAGNPQENDAPLIAGRHMTSAYLVAPGAAQVNVSDLDNPGKTGQTVAIPTVATYSYRITTPGSAYVGPPAFFPVRIDLVDGDGDLHAGAFHDCRLRALLPNFTPAPGSLMVQTAALDGGTVMIAAQAYDIVGPVILEVTDYAGRTVYSDPIEMMPNNLEYEIVVPSDGDATVGPPDVFPVTVRLRETATGHQQDDDRFLDISILDASGLPGAGAAGTTRQRLSGGEVTFDQSYTRAGSIIIAVSDSTGLSGQSASFRIMSDRYQRLQILVPGETPEPGVAAHNATGKSGTPESQPSGERFLFTTRAVDQFWNLVDTVSGGRIHYESDDGAFLVADNPWSNDAPFVGGLHSTNAFLITTGSAIVGVSDLDHPTLPGQTVTVPTTFPYEYRITVPDTAMTGPIPGFAMAVSLVDPVDDSVVAGNNHRIYLEPLSDDYDPASGNLGVVETFLIDGTAVIGGQNYSVLENIRIRVHDDMVRSATSPVIVMRSTGTYYRVSIPDSAVVGGPGTFPVDIEMIDGATGNRVVSRNGLVSLEALNASTGEPGTGVLGIGQQLMVDGQADVAESYTLAEEIQIRVSDESGAVGISNTCRMMADTYKRLQLLAPGEAAVQGQLTGNGKIGTPIIQSARLSFALEVRAVDQYWNPVPGVNDGSIVLDCPGNGELSLVNPADEAAHFVGGMRSINVMLDGLGSMDLFASDASRPEAAPGSARVIVAEGVYNIVVPDTAFVGPPSTFPISVSLVNPDTGELVPESSSFTMTALDPHRDPIEHSLGVTTGNLVGGEATISDQFYSISEEIVIMVSDERGRTAYSSTILIIPMNVNYAVAVPDTVIVNQGWEMTVERVDVSTGLLVGGYDHMFQIEATSAWSGASRPDTTLTPEGHLRFTYGTTVNGKLVLEGQTYDRAETIYLRVFDDLGGNTYSYPITVLPSTARSFTVDLQLDNDKALDAPLRPGDRVQALVQTYDLAGNHAAECDVSYKMIGGDASLGASGAKEATVKTDTDGSARMTVDVAELTDRNLMLEVVVGSLQPQRIQVEVAGPPTAEFDLEGVASPYTDGWYVSFDTMIDLGGCAGVENDSVICYFDIDGDDGFLPTTLFESPFSLGGIIEPDPGLHVLRFYPVEVGSGVRGAVQTVNFYTTQAMTSAKPITNRPNPFRPGIEDTVILFNPPHGGTVNIVIYDLYGSVVRTEVMDAVGGLTNEFTWNGMNGAGRLVGNGGYICRITGNGFDLRRKIAAVN